MLPDDFREFMRELHAENFEQLGGVGEVYFRDTKQPSATEIDVSMPLGDILDSISTQSEPASEAYTPPEETR